MKSITLVALMVGMIPLFPSASFADNVVTSRQEVYQSTTIGGAKVIKPSIQRSISIVQNSGRRTNNANGTYQKIQVKTTVVNNGKVDIKSVIRETHNGAQTDYFYFIQ